MAWANRNLSPDGAQPGGTCRLHRHPDIYNMHPTTFFDGPHDRREGDTKPGHTASGCKHAASHATRAPPTPSSSLGCLSFCVAFLCVFTVNLHEASLSLLISRGASQLPVLDHAVEALQSEQAVLPAALVRGSRAPKNDFPMQAGTLPRLFSDSDVISHDSSSSPAGSSPPPPPLVFRLPRAPLQSSATSQVRPPKSRRLAPQMSQSYTDEHSSNSTAAFRFSFETVSNVLSASKLYFLRTFREAFQAPSPLPQGMPFVEDILIAWHLLFQTIGCLLCGAAADAKGRRWVLLRAMQVLAATSLVFTFAALTAAQLLRPSVGNSSVDFSKSDANNFFRSVEGLSPRSSDLVVLSELPRSHGADCRDSEGDPSNLFILTYPHAWLHPVSKLVSLFPRFSIHAVTAVLLYILIVISVICYSLAAAACGGAAVVAQCLCLEAAASFPLRSNNVQAGYSTAASFPVQSNNVHAGYCSHAPETQGSGNRETRAFCENASHGGSGGANESDQMSAAAHAADVSLQGLSNGSATLSLFYVDASVDLNAQSVRGGEELRSPLLAQRRGSPAFVGAAGNVLHQVDFRCRAFFAALGSRCRTMCRGLRRSAYAAIRPMMCSAAGRGVIASVYKASVPPLFYSSPYTPVAYLVGMQSAARLFLPVGLTAFLKAVSIPASSGLQSDGLEEKVSGGPLTTFPLFCVAFSVPILPLCILLCVLTSCFLGENPYFLHQRKVLLRHLSLGVSNALNESRLTAKRPARRTSARAAGRTRDTSLKRRGTAFLPTGWRPHLVDCAEKRSEDPFHSLQRSSLSLPSLADLLVKRQEGYPHRGQRRRSEVPPSPRHRVAQRRRAFSCCGLDTLTSARHQIFSRVSAPLRRDVSTPAGAARHIGRTRHTGGDLSLSRASLVCGSRHDDGHSCTAVREFSGFQERPGLSVQLACTATKKASEGVADRVIEGDGREDVTVEAWRSVNRQPYERGERSDPAVSSNVVDAVRKSLRVYRSYLSFDYSTSLVGVLLPAAFIGASLYLRGVFRYLLLDCVVIEQEVENKMSVTVAARGAGVDVESKGESDLVSVKASPWTQVASSDDSPAAASSYSSTSFLSGSPTVLSSGEPCAQCVSAELLLFQLSTPVLFVRLCTCLIPVFLSSTLPPKPLQMLGCIFCGFLSFGIAVTLEALTQNFPDIPPISSASTASSLYEVVFCFCSSVPAFTSVLLPMQGFHTGVRCGFAGAVSACVRAAAAISLVGLSALLSYFPSSRYAGDSGAASNAALEGRPFILPANKLGAPNHDTCTSVACGSSSGGGTPTSSNDWCSADAAFIAATTCAYYVMAAAFTLLYTTHVRLPRILISPQVRRALHRMKFQRTQPRHANGHCSDGEHEDVHAERRRSPQWTESVRGSTLLAADNLFLEKLHSPLAVVNVCGDSVEHGSVGSETGLEPGND